MAKIERFEDIESWKKARVLTTRLYAVTNAGAFARDFELRGQIRRAAVSIMSNIAEGFERGGGERSFVDSCRLRRGPRARFGHNSLSRSTPVTLHPPSSKN